LRKFRNNQDKAQFVLLKIVPEYYQAHKTKTLMNKKDSIIQRNNSVKHFTIQNSSTELVELLEEDLKQIVGGVRLDGGPGDTLRAVITILPLLPPPPPPPPPTPTWNPPPFPWLTWPR
jgi:hypothetical protein